MDQSRPNNGLRVAGMTLLSALALTACGGGGGAPAPADNGSLPSNTGGGSGTGSGGSNTPSTSTSQSVFRVSETSQSTSTGSTRQLVVVDSRNHTAVLKLDLPAHSAAGADWYVSDRYTAASDGASAHIDGASQLYVIQNRHVARVDLRGTTVGTAQTVSSISDACGFARTGFIELGLDGTQSWLEVVTAGPDGQCDQTIDNGVTLVDSNASPTQAGIQGGSNGLELIETVQDSLSSPATGILALDRSTAKLGVYSTDLKTVLYPVAVSDHAVQKNERAQSIGHMPSAPFQALIQLGSSLYVSSISNGQMVLGSPVLQLATPESYPRTTADSQNLYLANGTDLIVISPTGSMSKLGNLAAAAGRVSGMWVSQSSVLVQQTLDTTQPGTNATLTAFSKSNGTATVLAQGASPSDGQVVGVVNDTVFFRQTGTNPNASWLSDIFKTTAQGGTPTSLATGVYISAYMWSPQIRLSGIDVLQVVWCEPLSGATDCSNAPLLSYNLSTGQKLTLGTVPLDAGWTNVVAYASNEPFAARTNLMELWRYGGPPAYGQDVVLWTYNADTANSLAKVTTP